MIEELESWPRRVNSGHTIFGLAPRKDDRENDEDGEQVLHRVGTFGVGAMFRNDCSIENIR